MKLITHEPCVQIFINGVQITFPNQYTILIKNGLSAKCTQTKQIDNTADMVIQTRFGGSRSPNVEVEVYDPKQNNISSKFGEKDSESIGYVTPVELTNLMYIISSLKDDPKGLKRIKPNRESRISKADK